VQLSLFLSFLVILEAAVRRWGYAAGGLSKRARVSHDVADDDELAELARQPLSGAAAARPTMVPAAAAAAALSPAAGASSAPPGAASGPAAQPLLLPAAEGAPSSSSAGPASSAAPARLDFGHAGAPLARGAAAARLEAGDALGGACQDAAAAPPEPPRAPPPPSRHAGDVFGDAYAVTSGDTGERVYCRLAPPAAPAAAGPAALRALQRARGPLLGRPIGDIIEAVRFG